MMPDISEFIDSAYSDISTDELGRRNKVDLLSPGFNDSGNAERLIRRYGGDLRYCHDFRKWLVWDGKRWAVDKTDQSRLFAKRTMMEFLRQAIASAGKSADEAQKFAGKSLDARRISSMLSLAEPEIAIEPDKLDTNPDLLNFENGTMNLRTGRFYSHQRRDFITKLVHYDYCSEAECPLWLRFLDEIMGVGPDAGEAEFDRAARFVAHIQRAIGYSLTGHTIEKTVFVVFGGGNNGKSTMLSSIRTLIEEYSTLLQVDTLMVRQESNNTQSDLADLRGARFVQTSETEEGQRLAQGKLKRITQGMGRIKAVRKYENPIEFPETHKLWMDTNRKPNIRDADDKATFNRLNPIPFLVEVKEPDKELPGKLLKEAEGILAWAVRGARLWHESGLQRPAEVEVARDEWRNEEDQLKRFIDEFCVVGNKDFECRAATFYESYRVWSVRGGEKTTMTSTMFGRKLTERGYRKKHEEDGWKYFGIRPRLTALDSDDS
jgi:putative DNA primase/helicase